MNQPFDTCSVQSTVAQTASTLFEKAADAVGNKTLPKIKLIWLELTGCSGNIISLLDGVQPGIKDLIERLADIVYDNSLMVSQGEAAMEKLFGVTDGGYILAVEGAVSVRDNGAYNVIGRLRGEPVTALGALKVLGTHAAHVLAVGTCASGGGISAARPNPAGCADIQSLLGAKVIRLPGCPCNPVWFLGTLAYILLYGVPPLDSRNRPTMFYGTLIHDRCPRRPCFDRGLFASRLGEETCLFKLGCRGPVTRTDCPLVRWNGHVNWPIGSDSPCIGCAAPGFPDSMEPFVSFDTTKG